MAGRPKRVIYPAGAQAASAERLAAAALKTATAAELAAASSVPWCSFCGKTKRRLKPWLRKAEGNKKCRAPTKEFRHFFVQCV